jgi:hypothetical protein
MRYRYRAWQGYREKSLDQRPYAGQILCIKLSPLLLVGCRAGLNRTRGATQGQHPAAAHKTGYSTVMYITRPYTAAVFLTFVKRFVGVHSTFKVSELVFSYTVTNQTQL